MNSKIKINIALIVILCLTAAAGIRAAGETDPAFNAALQDTTAGSVQRIFVQPDGKFYAVGNFTVAGNVGRSSIARFNADGTVDTSFYPPDFYRIVNTAYLNLTDTVIYAVAVQTDGKIIVGGNFDRVNGQTRRGAVRLNADGSLDTSFNPPFHLSTGIFDQISQTVEDIKIQPDGKILLAGSFQFDQAAPLRNNLVRVNADGSTDTTFPPTTNSEVKTIDLQSDGKIVYATSLGDSASGATEVRRLNADGSADNSFLPFTVSGPYIYRILIQSDGKILVGGYFFISGSNKNHFVRLNSNGTLDQTFNSSGATSANGPVTDISLTNTGKILIAGTFNNYSSAARAATARVNADGSLDTTYNFPVAGQYLYYVVAIAATSDGGAIVGGSSAPNQISPQNKLVRLDANGAVVGSFVGAAYRRGIGNRAIAQSDGKVIVGGYFNRVNGVNRIDIARLNQDGSADTGFAANISTISNVYAVSALALQTDGKILVGGSFMVSGSSIQNLARLNADGSTDTSFNPTLLNGGIISEIIALPGGKILIAGKFRLTEYPFDLNVARLNADGSTDTTFNESAVNSAGTVKAIKLQPGGKIVAVGTFTQIAGAVRTNIARLNADGGLDATFNPSATANGNILDVTILSTGSIVIGGDFSSVNGTGNHYYLARLLSDGTLDATFNTVTNNFVYTVERQSNDQILVGGLFTNIGSTGKNRIARFNAGGTLDESFGGAGANDTVRDIFVQTDGKVLISGEFSRVNGVSRVGVARLLNTITAPRTRFDFDGDGKADLAVFRPSNGFWYQLRSQNAQFAAAQFGQNGDQIAPADFDGDGKTDLAVFRDTVAGAGNFAYFYISNSSDNSFRPEQFGSTGDLPVTGDWDGDGKADLAVYRNGASAGAQSYFYYRPSSSPTENFRAIAWGASGDKPLVGDFDGDGKLDAAIYRPTTQQWYILRSSDSQVIATVFGAAGDVPVPADYDGDGSANIAVFRPSTGYWYTSTNPATNYGAVQFGVNGDLPVPADYDGDGKADVAVFRPSNGSWYLLRSTQGFTGVGFGTAGDKPIPNAYIR